MKIDIDEEGRFWEKDSSLRVHCAICREHTFVIVQKLGAIYAVHTRIASHLDLRHCIHVWKARSAPPECLEGFIPTDIRPRYRVSVDQFMGAIASAQGVIGAEAALGAIDGQRNDARIGGFAVADLPRVNMDFAPAPPRRIANQVRRNLEGRRQP